MFPGVALHVRQRGNDRHPCFREEGDRLVYLSALRALCERWGCALHAYCLMTNHVHLLLTPEAGGDPSMLMRDLGRTYVRYFNDRYGRTGTLWEGRFQSCLVDSPAYVIACYRYIEENPVRAGMVQRAIDYPWSSLGANAAEVRDQSMRQHSEYLALAASETLRRRTYASLFATPQDSSMIHALRTATNAGYPLAGEALRQRLANQGVRLGPDKPGPKCKPVSGDTEGQLALDVGKL